MRYVLLVDQQVRSVRAVPQPRTFRSIREEISRANWDVTLVILSGDKRDEFTLEAMADALGVVKRRCPLTSLREVRLEKGDVLLVRDSDGIGYYLMT